MQITANKKPRKTTYKVADRAHYKSRKVKNAIAKANQARLGITSTITPPPSEEVLQTSPMIQEPSTSIAIRGSRIINLEQLQESVGLLTSHSAECGGKYIIEGESMHSGLAVILQASCTKCQKHFSIRTSPRVQTQSGKKWSVNIGAVLGEMATGGGLAQLNTTLAMMDVPGMHRKMYTEMEEFIGSEMTKQLSDSMRKAAEEEKEHAISAIIYIKGFRQSQWWLMVGGLSEAISIRTTRKAVLQLFLDATLRNYFFLVSGTNSAQCVP